ncbi:leucine-rich repeat domain-containing protein [uncultured Ruminococcus sp.]|uniref:leucine-rich repeat domain-containing protein n=1 Tax=uncultured Ruminococcus sp. TaxID=165186 RepID=UPI0025CCD072|nr:leucine-rich repeat domain-containing protein [uncultured Ruminococcus sp.]
MLQSKARLLELNAKLAETLTSKGVTATADETTTTLVNKVADITSGDDSALRGLIQRDLTEITIPEGTTSIGHDAFYKCENLEKIIIPYGVTSIGASAFFRCKKLKNVKIPNSVKEILDSAFMYCSDITDLTIPDGVEIIGNAAFAYCSYVVNLYIPSSVKKMETNSFLYFNGLTYVTLGEGFNCDNLYLKTAKLSRETVVNMFNALADRTGLTAYTLTLGSTNLAKLTEQDILIATNKNWTLA